MAPEAPLVALQMRRLGGELWAELVVESAPRLRLSSFVLLWTHRITHITHI